MLREKNKFPIFGHHMTATYHKYILNFKKSSGTSRGIIETKETWFIIINENEKTGIGECGILRGLSIDDRYDYEATLRWACQNIRLGLEVLLSKLLEFPSIQFGLEMAFSSLESESPFQLFPSEFTKGNDSIPINGLIWMGSEAFMKQQIKEKIESGHKCIKLKIGAIDFDAELSLLKSIRKEFFPTDLELRVDANGAFKPEEALEKLKRLSEFELHSIEQPIKPGQWKEMGKLCESPPLPIALDEELIGVFEIRQKADLLATIKPQFIILKPSFIGGFKGATEWIKLAEEIKISWWMTSALESNVGLNAIAQWTYTLQNDNFQGLGTGALYTNNFSSPLIVKNGTLRYDNSLNWDFNL